MIRAWKFKRVSTVPISPACKSTEEISTANKTKNIRSVVVPLKKNAVNNKSPFNIELFIIQLH